MGLFSSILKSALPAIGTLVGGPLGGAIGGVASTALGGASSSGAIKGASAAQQAAIQQAIAQQQQTQTNYQPFLSAGTGATEQMLRLLGLGDSNTGVSVNGNPAYSAAEQQAGAISNLQQSPLYTSQYTAGLDAINQSAAATGGLRGGNQALAQSNFGSSLLSQVIQQQLANLGSVSNQGLTAASGIAGSNNNTSGLLTQQGNAQAGSILGQQAVNNNTSTNLQSILANLTGGASTSGINWGSLNSGTASSIAGLNSDLSLSSLGITGW